MDEIEAKLRANKDISELLYYSEISKRSIEIDYKIFLLYTELMEMGKIYFGDKLDSLSYHVKKNINKCIKYCEYLREQYKEKKIDIEMGWSLWNKYIKETSNSLLKGLVEEQCEKFSSQN